MKRPIDYICAGQWVEKLTKSCRAYVGTKRTFDTDHRLVVMNITFPKSKHDLHVQVCKRTHNAKPVTQALGRDETLQKRFTEKLNETLQNVTSEDIDELNDVIVTSVKGCMENVCPTIEPRKKGTMGRCAATRNGERSKIM